MRIGDKKIKNCGDCPSCQFISEGPDMCFLASEAVSFFGKIPTWCPLKKVRLETKKLTDDLGKFRQLELQDHVRMVKLLFKTPADFALHEVRIVACSATSRVYMTNSDGQTLKLNKTKDALVHTTLCPTCGSEGAS